MTDAVLFSMIELEIGKNATRRREAFSIEAFPRVLLVNGDPIGTACGTGLTLQNLFAEWPSEKLAQIYTSSAPHEQKGDFEYCLRPAERRGLHWLSATTGVSRPIAATAGDLQGKLQGGGRRHATSAVRSGLRKWLDLWPYELPDEVEKAIMQFRPDIVYTLLGGIQICALALHCAKLCKVGIVPHFMDDWVSTQYAGRPDLYIQRRLLLRSLRKVIGVAPLGIAISNLMGNEYSRRYGIPFYDFMNCMAVPERVEAEPRVAPETGLQLVYVGGLHLDRWRSLKDIGAALTELNAEKIFGRLYVYAPASDLAEYGSELSGPSIKVVRALEQSEVAGVLASSHVLVHVESFARSYRRYTRLSISTKIPQYAASGRPLLCYGPGEVASLRFVRENECGIVVGSQDRSELLAALRRILQNAELRSRLGTNAWTTARQKFNTAEVRVHFRDVIARAVLGRGN
jgi:glycosyltransferase involved in cell wall biosynthesis